MYRCSLFPDLKLANAVREPETRTNSQKHSGFQWHPLPTHVRSASSLLAIEGAIQGIHVLDPHLSLSIGRQLCMQGRNFGGVKDQIRFSGVAANGQSTRRKFERVIRELTGDKVQQQRSWGLLGDFTKGIDRVTSFGNRNCP